MTKRALLDADGKRVAQVVNAGEEFPVAPQLQWVDAPDDAKADAFEFKSGAIEKKIEVSQIPVKAVA